jgi:general secretion pathway protein C
MKLTGVYQGPRHRLAVITRGSQSFVVHEGETVLGYRIDTVGERSISLSRESKEYRLELPLSKGIGSKGTAKRRRAEVREEIIDDEGNKLVPRVIIERYAKDPKEIWKEIGIDPYKKGELLQGFKVRFVRRGSDFAKLGLKQGDIIVGINGEPLVDYSTPMELMKNIDTLEELTLQIKRGNEELEIDYEIR